MGTNSEMPSRKRRGIESNKAFRLEDYKMLLLNRYLDEAYNVPKDLDELSTRIQKMLGDSDL